MSYGAQEIERLEGRERERERDNWGKGGEREGGRRREESGRGGEETHFSVFSER